MSNIKKMVESVLLEFPETRNSDDQLTNRIIYQYYNSEIIKVEGKWFTSTEIQKIVNKENVKRYRASFNQKGKYLPTEPSVIKARKQREMEMNEEFSHSNPSMG